MTPHLTARSIIATSILSLLLHYLGILLTGTRLCYIEYIYSILVSVFRMTVKPTSNSIESGKRGGGIEIFIEECTFLFKY